MTIIARLLGLGLAGLCLAVAPASAEQVTLPKIPPPPTTSDLKLGAYDPHGDFSRVSHMRIEHLYLPWEDVDLSSLSQADDYARQRGRDLMITVEPWSWSTQWRLSPPDLQRRIVTGAYDGIIASLCGRIGQLESPVTIRWAQEMDDDTGQFTWARWSPSDYVAAYRHVVDHCRAAAPKARFMWSPLGRETMAAYYPGDAYVDVVGLSVFGLQAYDQKVNGRELSFADHLRPKYERALRFDKPIVVAELGYEGDDRYVADWARDVSTSGDLFPKLTGVVYFNDREVYPWPHGFGLPDWSVTSCDYKKREPRCLMR